MMLFRSLGAVQIRGTGCPTRSIEEGCSGIKRERRANPACTRPRLSALENSGSEQSNVPRSGRGSAWAGAAGDANR